MNSVPGGLKATVVLVGLVLMPEGPCFHLSEERHLHEGGGRASATIVQFEKCPIKGARAHPVAAVTKLPAVQFFNGVPCEIIPLSSNDAEGTTGYDYLIGYGDTA